MYCLSYILQDCIFREVIKETSPLQEFQSKTSPLNQDLTPEEESGLQYAAGYVCLAMHNKYIKKHIQECISELIDHENGGEDGCDILGEIGYLVHVKNSTYQAFYSMEKATHQLLQKKLMCGFFHGQRNFLSIPSLTE